jgi:hypothetical protein
MQINDKITQDQLSEQGWNFTGYIGNCQIWHKDRDNILWNPDTKLVEFVC